MKISFKKIAATLAMILATSAFSQIQDKKHFTRISIDERVSKSDYKIDSLKIDPYGILTAKGKTEYLEVLKKNDWFKRKEDVRKKEIIYAIQNDLDVRYLFLALEDFNFDTEGFETAESYKKLLNELINIAGVQKKIKNVKVFRKGHLINISVLVNNNYLEYKININENQDWIDLNFVGLFINEQLLSKADCTQKFFLLPAIDQIGNLIFISAEELEEAIKIG